jgi:hypothetical protein
MPQRPNGHAALDVHRRLKPDEMLRRKGGTYPLSRPHGHFGLVRLTALGRGNEVGGLSVQDPRQLVAAPK